MGTNQNLEALMQLLCKTTAQNPTTDKRIAALKGITLDEVNTMLDQLYEGKAISSVKNIKGGIEQRLVWVTGLPYRPAIPQSAKPAATHRIDIPAKQKNIAVFGAYTEKNDREKIIPLPSDHPIEIVGTTMEADIQLPQPATKPKQEPSMPAEQKRELIVPKDIKDPKAKTALKILRLLYANTKVTSPQIRDACSIAVIDSYIKPYMRKGYIAREINDSKVAVYKITDSARRYGSADALYEVGKQKKPSNNLAKPLSKTTLTVVEPVNETIEAINDNVIPASKPAIVTEKENTAEKLQEITDVPSIIAKLDTPTMIKALQGQINIIGKDVIIPTEAEEKVDFELPDAIVNAIKIDSTSDDVYINKTITDEDKPLYAITDIGTLMLFGFNFEPIELTKEQTQRLIHFIANTGGVV